MSVQLNHTIVAARDKRRSAAFLAEILALPAPVPFGPFMTFQVANDVTLDFVDASGEIATQHYAFLVSESEFDAILGRIRARGIPFRSNVQGPADNQVNTQHGGRIVYWNEPDGHYWEMLTQSYARRPEGENR